MDIAATIDTSGLDALIAGLDDAVAAGIDEGTAEIAGWMRALVRVATGFTQSTVAAHPATGEGDTITGTATVGGAGLLLEGGWHTQAGRQVGPFPFIRPSWDLVWPSVPARITARIALLMSGAAPSFARL